MLAYGRSTGELLVDAALPFDDVTTGINAGSFLHGRTLGLFGRSASVIVGLPYA